MGNTQSAGLAGSAVERSFSSGNRASHWQRLGGAARKLIFSGESSSPGYAPAKAKVMVCEWEDGRLQIRYRDRAVAWEEIPARSSSVKGRTRLREVVK